MTEDARPATTLETEPAADVAAFAALAVADDSSLATDATAAEAELTIDETPSDGSVGVGTAVGINVAPGKAGNRKEVTWPATVTV